MSKKVKLLIYVLLVLVLNTVIYYRAYLTIKPVNVIFAECARNSGRISAAFNLVILFMVGFVGLKRIFKDDYKKYIFQTLITLFAVNHLVHFFFVSQNFKWQAVDLNISSNMHGFITFICLILLPILLYLIKRLTIIVYSLLLVHLANVTYFMSISFYARYKPEDPAYLHRIGILIMIMTIVYMLYGVYKERSIRFE